MANERIVFRNYFVSGRVQGVGFRAFTRAAAIRLGLRGWVRNLADGRVEAVAAGPENSLENFANELRKGPPHGSVSQVIFAEIENASFEGFEIRRDA